MSQDKKDLYLLPGTMCNALLWSEMLPQLTASFKVSYVPTPFGDNLDVMLDRLLAFLPDEPVDLVGFSLGGYLASLMAIRYPLRVKKIFIIANSSGVLPASEIAQRQEALRFVNQHGYAGMSRRKAASLIDHNHPNTDAIVAIIRQMDKELGKTVFLSQMNATTDRPDQHQDFHQLPIPTTFYYSANDRLVDSGWIDDCVENNGNFEQIIQPGSGHMLPLEQPQSLVEHLVNWSRS